MLIVLFFPKHSLENTRNLKTMYYHNNKRKIKSSNNHHSYNKDSFFLQTIIKNSMDASRFFI